MEVITLLPLLAAIVIHPQVMFTLRQAVPAKATTLPIVLIPTLRRQMVIQHRHPAIHIQHLQVMARPATARQIHIPHLLMERQHMIPPHTAHLLNRIPLQFREPKLAG